MHQQKAACTSVNAIPCMPINNHTQACLFFSITSAMASTANLVLLLLVLIVFLAMSGDARRNRNSRHMNAIDRCWRRDPHWAADRQRLAMCSVGFAGKMRANRGRGLTRYTVTDPSDDPLRPRPGTLRYGATLTKGKVWITFQSDMLITLRQPLLVHSFTTIDGRGARVHIAYGAGFKLYKVRSVIIHGLEFHHLHTMPAGAVRGPGGETVQLGGNDGDAIRLVGSSKVWIDHNTLYRCHDGLLDVTVGSTAVTISNNWFRDHDKVMLLGHDDSFIQDKRMRVTVAFNRFGPHCNQRMPRIRYGYAHVVNNLYDGWGNYAIGGSMNPDVKSEANMFIAPETKKSVTSIMGNKASGWNFQSVNDALINGAYFKHASNGKAMPGYRRGQRFPVTNANFVRSLTRHAGAIRCSTRARC